MKKATEDGKNVVVQNGVMSVDDVIVFSLQQGFIQSHNDES